MKSIHKKSARVLPPRGFSSRLLCMVDVFLALSIASTQGWFEDLSARDSARLWLAVGRQGAPRAQAFYAVWLEEEAEYDRIRRELDAEDLAREDGLLYFAGYYVDSDGHFIEDPDDAARFFSDGYWSD